MTAEGPEEQPPAPAPVVPPDLRLRGERPRVTRLSRKVLITLGAVSALAIAGALGYALQTRNRSQTGQELLSTESRLFAQTNQQPQPVGLVAPPATATQGGPTPT